MLSNINENCDFCNSKIEHVYNPINSRRGMELYVCQNCGLLESKPTRSYISRPPGNMSSDSYLVVIDILKPLFQIHTLMRC